ncbi:NAD(P)-dependent oxidoreductase [Streptomyces sp. NPDC056154]|uniref:NAD(P)-dependent oxidoreductase n=1 Tax=unclassified Streptomyces TaxID=2593676 RepID=UPI0035DEDE7C
MGTVGRRARRLRSLTRPGEGAGIPSGITAPCPLIDTSASTDEVAAGRISAVLDVTDPESLPPDSRLLDLPGAFLTPHPVGSLGNELEWLGRAVPGEAGRLVPGPPLARPLPGKSSRTAADLLFPSPDILVTLRCQWSVLLWHH